MMAFSSASSVGTLPFTMECSEKLGAKREISSFVLPLGATINMDGTAIYQGVCAVFIAACYGIHLDLGNMITIVLHRNAGIHRHRRCSRRRHGHAGNGTPECQHSRGGHCAGGRY